MVYKVHIAQRNLDPHSNVITGLSITTTYDEGVSAEATILLRPCVVPNDQESIRKEIERLGKALIAAAQSPEGITS